MVRNTSKAYKHFLRASKRKQPLCVSGWGFYCFGLKHLLLLLFFSPSAILWLVGCLSQQGVSSGELAVGVERCNVVVVDCRSSDIPLFSVVRSGSRFGDCVVVFASPDPCVFSRRTQVREGVMCSVEEVGLVNNVVVRVSCGDGVSKELIYPKKTYYLVKSGYIEPLKRGSPPISSGLILAGPPGTGKSELAVAVALSLGIVPRRVMPSDILSMWIGNSEKALDRVFREARESQPSVLIIDDAEFLIRPRALASSVVGTGEVLTNL